MTFALVRAGTQYTSLIKPLQWLVVVIIFLFFLRIARAVTVQARTPRDAVAPAKQRRRRRNRPFALEFVEPAAREGERVELGSTLSVGRGPASDLRLEDQYVSAKHATVVNDKDGLFVTDHGSTNGTYVNEKRIEGRTRLKRGDVVQFGGFVLEVVR
jgi:hypothetical protein